MMPTILFNVLERNQTWMADGLVLVSAVGGIVGKPDCAAFG